MRRTLLLVPALLLALAIPAAHAGETVRAPAVAQSPPGAASVPLAARGRGFGSRRRSPSSSSRRRTVPRRSPSMRRIGRNILRALGIAWLLSILFGWGSGGGGPLGLLLLLGVLFLLFSMARRRRRPAW
jgi:hypothetical protein